MAVRFSGVRPMLASRWRIWRGLKPAVHQHARLVGFDVGSVAGGTAAENREFDCHAGTLMSAGKRGNAIQRSEMKSGWRGGPNRAGEPA